MIYFQKCVDYNIEQQHTNIYHENIFRLTEIKGEFHPRTFSWTESRWYIFTPHYEWYT